MKVVRAIIALVSIWFISFGVISYHQNRIISYYLLIAGGLMLAVAYEAFHKPHFFIVPICAIFGAFALPADSEGITFFIGTFFGIAISDMCITHYFKNNSKL